ncbi:MAG: hypothetical protein P4N59_19365, partial [Negativicutes bacterium]|nr:hypothetical protein [Negativicutes bacterium]
ARARDKVLGAGVPLHVESGDGEPVGGQYDGGVWGGGRRGVRRRCGTGPGGRGFGAPSMQPLWRDHSAGTPR